MGLVVDLPWGEVHTLAQPCQLPVIHKAEKLIGGRGEAQLIAVCAQGIADGVCIADGRFTDTRIKPVGKQGVKLSCW